MKLFVVPVLFSVVMLMVAYIWGGSSALLLASILAVLEITLSFDNAVVNAKVLKKMSEKWQRRFLTWGILVAVFGTRLVLPAIIVGVAAGIAPWAAARLAFVSPEEYGHLLEKAEPMILAFGAVFLLMVACKYFFDSAKQVHWIRVIETHLSRWGRIEALEIALVLSTLMVISFLTHAPQAPVLIAGLSGLILFILVQGVANSFQVEAGAVASNSAALFVYLNILDSAFSLDGVVGAFALTSDLIIIFAGLGIGAFFVRSVTVYLVQRNTLDTFVYLEHGAHWAILGLALCMLAGLVVHVPELITGLIGFVFIGFSIGSSILLWRTRMAS